MGRLVCLLVVVCLSVLVARSNGLRVASFNIKWLSMNKINNATVLGILKKVLLRYDIVLVLEVRNPAAITALVTELNRNATESPYTSVISKALGRSSYKEEYAFIYRTKKVIVTSTLQFVDKEDVFEREPFGVVFYSPTTVVRSFMYIGMHLKPSDVPRELSHVVDVYDNFTATTHTQNALLAGDLNADCHYLSRTALEHNRLFTDSRFRWLVDNEADTTVSTHTDCAYDRFITAGQVMGAAIARRTVQVYDFQAELGLDFNTAWSVSDHYPIELVITDGEEIPVG
ncbi:hypothetical protein ScPMuIL_017794 [Solemya velum]